MQRNSGRIRTGQSGCFWLGANFWSRAGGPLMWRHYEPDVVQDELAVLRDHGLNVTRSFLYWPDFHPAPDRLDEQMVARMADFLDRHHALGLQTIPTFIVGHMSGQNWDPSWRGDRDLYGDVWLVGRQAWFVREMTTRFHDHPAIAGWLLSNEMPIYGRPPHVPAPAAPAEQVRTWVQLLVDAVRAGGGRQPVSSGDGTWGVEMTGVDNGFAVRDIAPLVSFLGPHVYRMETDVVRQHLAAAFVCELAGFAGLPVVLEEFGVTTDFVSAANAGHYYRQVLHSSLLAGATGWLAWNNTDYDDLAEQEPYSHHPFEMHFGITTSTGRPKPPLTELRDFRRVLDEIDVDRCSRPDADAAIIVTSYVEVGYPFTEPADHTDPIESLRQAFVASREADLPIGLARELDGLPGDVRLLIAPSIKQLTSATWRELAERAHAGATVYVSYFAGSHCTQRGPWYADLDHLFGVEHQLVYGLADPIPGDSVDVTFVRDFGGISASTVLTFPVAGSVEARSFLPVEPTDATVIAEDPQGHPVLLERLVGTGRVVLATYPFEYLAAAHAAVNPEPTHRLYAALATVAGVRRDVVVDDPRVHVAEMTHEDGTRFIWFISQAGESSTVAPRLGPGLVLRARDGDPDDLGAGVVLEPFGVRVLRLDRGPT